MAYLNTTARTSAATKTDTFQPAGRLPTNFGVFMGYIKDVEDIQKNGRIRVWIPEFGSPPDDPNGWIIANYCSPFAGATNVDTTSEANIQSFEGTQTSYGMWMIPPDINNIVLVMFINGDPSRGIWIGSLYNQFVNHMIPGMAASVKNWQYPGKSIPVAEYNKWDTGVTQPDRAIKPYQRTKFRGLGNQGLITDQSRGITTSSARRESPSKVFGILTPGPPIDSNASPENIRRKGGSSFIMDDDTGSEYVQLTTKTGAQIRLDETNGFVYLINRDGTAWVQMDQRGNIDIFGAGDISMRAQRDINIRGDRNVNIEAGQNIFMKAAKDTKENTTTFTYDVNNIPKPSIIPLWKYVGEGNGAGGNIVMQALNNWQSTTKNTAYLTVTDNNMNINIGNALSVTTVAGGQDYNSRQGIRITTSAAVDVAAIGNIRVGSTGTISVIGITGVVVCTDANLDLKAGQNIQEAAANSILLTASDVAIDAQLTVTGTANLLAAYAGIAGSLGSTSSFTAPSANPATAEGALSAGSAPPAEIKPLNDKVNILATWKPSVTYPTWRANTPYNAGDIVIYNNIIYIANKAVPASATFDLTLWNIFTPEDKFVRNSEALQTTISRFPTYEPCPEHEKFSFANISGYTPTTTPDAKTYDGSGSSGNSATASPPPAVNPGANNTSVQGDPPADSVISKDFNMKAYECQLKIHEGVRYASYNDSLGLPTAGIGHLLRTNEVSQYPVVTPVAESQVTSWFGQDAPVSISGAQRLLGIDTWDKLSDVRKRACADLCYNMGERRLSGFRNFLSAMKATDYNAAGTELRNSKWFSQVGRRGPNIVTMIVQNVDPNGCDKKFPAG